MKTPLLSLTFHLKIWQTFFPIALTGALTFLAGCSTHRVHPISRQSINPNLTLISHDSEKRVLSGMYIRVIENGGLVHSYQLVTSSSQFNPLLRLWGEHFSQVREATIRLPHDNVVEVGDPVNRFSVRSASDDGSHLRQTIETRFNVKRGEDGTRLRHTLEIPISWSFLARAQTRGFIVAVDGRGKKHEISISPTAIKEFMKFHPANR